MSPHCIWIVTPDGDSRAHGLDEVAESLSYGFQALGHTLPIVRRREDVVGRAVVLGCNLLTEQDAAQIPSDAVLFNFEQIYDESPWLTDLYLHQLRNHEVWDYSRLNIERLNRMGVRNARFCGIGYVPQLSRIPKKELDIDVLMYGLRSERRVAIMDALERAGRKVVFLNGVYGGDRDGYIARSKIVLNIHYYAARIFEIVRVSYLLSNEKFVISEPGADHQLEDPYRDGIVFAPYESVVETCEHYLDNLDKLKTVARNGFDLFRSKPQQEYLADLIGA